MPLSCSIFVAAYKTVNVQGSVATKADDFKAFHDLPEKVVADIVMMILCGKEITDIDFRSRLGDVVIRQDGYYGGS